MAGFATISTAMPTKEIERQWYPLTLEQLRARLARGESLPKDGFVGTDVAGLHSNPFRHRDRNFERTVLHALTARTATPAEHLLALRMANCTRGDRCGRIDCFICNQRYWRRRRKLLTALAAEHPDDAISFCTVIIGHSQHGYLPLKAMIADFKTIFANVLARFVQVRWLGRIEIDYVDQLICPLPPEKAATLRAMGWDEASEMATLVPHAHIVLLHRNVHRATLGYHLKRPFPETRRVQLRALRVTRDPQESLDHLVRYPLKPPLDRQYLAGRNSKNHIPRRPQVVRYAIRVREVLDRPDRHRHLEFDHL